MSTSKFITIHDVEDSTVRRVRDGAIDQYLSYMGTTYVVAGKATLRVTETPEQIDAMLGVTQPVDIAAAVMKAMDASDERIDDKGDEYCAGFDDAHAIFYQRVKGALSAATGTVE